MRAPLWLAETPRRAALVAGVAIAVSLSVCWLLDRWRQNHAPIGELEVEVVGNDYRLHFRYPGEDLHLDNADDRLGARHLYLPSGAAVRLRLTSDDYIYLIEIPEADVYEIAAPDLVFETRFAAPQLGPHALLGSQMCGYDHAELLGRVVVQTPAEFRRTMKRLSPAPETTP